MKEFSLVGFAGFLMSAAVQSHAAEHRALDEAAKIIQDGAREVLGTYEYGWAPLAESTIARKARGDAPLLETAEMRASIQRQVGEGWAEIGSNNDKAVWQELGTSHIPPRSFLVETAIRKEEEVHKIVGREIVEMSLLLK